MAALPSPSPIKPCWVNDEHGHQPALLLEWKNTESGWKGRVIRPVPDGPGWTVVEDWIPAEHLERG